MPIDSSRSTAQLPTYAQALSLQLRSADTLPPPPYEYPPAYSTLTNTDSINRIGSGRSSNTTSPQIDQQLPADRSSTLGVRMLMGFLSRI
ncbi:MULTISPECIES: hypothetical protein [Pseudomonas]|jgi:hypothetical protein|uniref:Uncharacterized protein n=1 Tax=Pseudomonas extremorientalis TaxID=169669 RepID=A0ABY0S988_9PSED|nr:MULTISPECIES: hypothetical protein [Pseudomonas]KAB0521616.1 hypothetical protein F7R08_00170 [Pseudomonas extremorientalis]QZP19871.1 hypothetical protein K5K89_21480 [Pseudomonas sp. DR208]WLG55370.1 hypothetical protein PSH77_22265 [Pseudomonas extremorientalis]SDO94042.1 hypothetical protein SAMN04490184_1847 [Pseudomonas extremorientalis]